MAENPVRFERLDGHVARIVLDKPDTMNALDQNMVEIVRNCLDKVETDSDYADIRCVILTGTGRAFCAGLYLNPEFISREGMSLDDNLPEEAVFGMAEAIRSSRVPVIAAVNGAAVGAGLSVVLLCDFAIAADTSKLSAAFTDRGLIPDLGATYILPRLMGKSGALRFILMTERLSAEAALRAGLVQEVVPADQLEERALEVARIVAAKPPLAVRASRGAIWASYSNSYQAQIDHERAVQNRLGETADFRESVAAFLEKRQPLFRGQ
jgi:2-(1,2-epoxy-1,2-dihydrophenyl)acetyl-CoA isomerase